MAIFTIKSKKYGNIDVLYSIEDQKIIDDYTWCLIKSRTNKLVFTVTTTVYKKDLSKKYNYDQETFYLHRLVTGAKKGEVVDHINRNTLDNRRENLRITTQGNNTKNRSLNINSKSGYRGVSVLNRDGKITYQVSIMSDKKQFYGGTFQTAQEASQVYNQLAEKYHGEFASLNPTLDLVPIKNSDKRNTKTKHKYIVQKINGYEIRVSINGVRMSVGFRKDLFEAVQIRNIFLNKYKMTVPD